MANELVLKNISKHFGGVKALKDVTISFNAGEVHGIIGENGAGKSTFINVLSGAFFPTEGTIEFWGKSYNGLTPRQAIELGIATVHQELNQLDAMTVADNIMMAEYVEHKGFVDRKAICRKTKELLANFNLDIDPEEKLCNLSTANRQLVEIVKVLNMNAKVIIFDEPTAAMTVKEQEMLHGIIKRLKSEGMTIIYISHILKELEVICDRVSVLRDGTYITTLPIEEMPVPKMVSLMVGRELGNIYVDKEPCSNEVVLSVRNLTGNGVWNISFDLHRGEILGLAGLVGAGRSELIRVLYGAARKDEGKVLLYGKEVDIRSPGEAIEHGIGLVPEDRKTQGAFLDKSILWNISLINFKKLTKHGFRLPKAERQEAEHYRDALRIKTASLDNNTSSLSGGNQQKVVIAKMLSAGPDILIFDEPTKGVDVGAKKEIYQLMVDLTRQGKSIIMVSSDMGELLGISERIIVLYGGTYAGELTKEEAYQERILQMASGLE